MTAKIGTGRLQIEITTILILKYNQLRMEVLITQPHRCIINLGCRRIMTQNMELNRLMPGVVFKLFSIYMEQKEELQGLKFSRKFRPVDRLIDVKKRQFVLKENQIISKL
jgi:hypothetical protein